MADVIKKIIQTRTTQKHDTEENWLKAVNFIPKKGEIIIYDKDSNYDYNRIKIGDGDKTASQLPFVTDNYYTKLETDEKLETKQNSLNQNQLSAVNSGITNEKVTKYDGYETIINNKYTKPTDGIPKTDLSKDVQNSLDKADSALQSHQKITTGSANGTIAVDGTDVSVKGLGSIAYKNSLTKSDVGLGLVVNAGQDSTPTANSTNYVTSGGVKNYVDTAISGISQFQYEVVESLPSASADTMGKIYLVPHSHSSDDGYDEYITLESGTTTKTYSWEKIGNTDIDLSEYVNSLSGVSNNGVVTNVEKSGNIITITSNNLTTADPTASGNTTSFIDTISQAANGKITATKKTVSAATTSSDGLMSSDDKTKLDGISDGATNVTDNTVTNWGYLKTDNLVGTDGIVIDKASDSEKIEVSGKNLIKDPYPGINNTGANIVNYKPYQSSDWGSAFVRNTHALVNNAESGSITGYDNNGVLYAKTTSDDDYSVVNKKYADENYVKKTSKQTIVEQASSGNSYELSKISLLAFTINDSSFTSVDDVCQICFATESQFDITIPDGTYLCVGDGFSIDKKTISCIANKVYYITIGYTPFGIEIVSSIDEIASNNLAA